MKKFLLLFCLLMFPTFIFGANVYFDYPTINSSFQANCNGTCGVNYHIHTVSQYFIVDWYGARVRYPNGTWGSWQTGQSGGWVFSQMGSYLIEGAVHVVSDLGGQSDYYMYSEPYPFYTTDTPPSVSISGPTNIQWGHNYTWTATASGGNPSYSYQWYELFASIGPMNITPLLPPRDIWLPIGSNSRYLTYSFPLYNEIRLKCIITDDCQLQATSNILILHSSADLSKLKSQDNLFQKSSLAINQNDNIVTTNNYCLYQNSPNPFNPSTVIEYQIPENGLVRLRVLDILGREVALLVNENKDRGRYSVIFDASNLNSGIYLYQLKTSNFTSIKKMILLK